MFWKTFKSEIRARLQRPLLAGVFSLILILSSMLVIVAATANTGSWTREWLVQFVYLPLSISVASGVCSWYWFHTPALAPDGSRCQTCGYIQVGREPPSNRCPECGADPNARSSNQSAARTAVMSIGCLMIAWAVLCVLFATMCLGAWRHTA